MLLKPYRGVVPEVSYSMFTQTFQGEAWVDGQHLVFSSSTLAGLQNSFESSVDEIKVPEPSYSE